MASVSPTFIGIPARRMPSDHPRFGMSPAEMIRVRLRDSPFVNHLTRRRNGAGRGVDAIFPDSAESLASSMVRGRRPARFDGDSAAFKFMAIDKTGIVCSVRIDPRESLRRPTDRRRMPEKARRPKPASKERL